LGEKIFHAFDPSELGPESIIGGEGRLSVNAIPAYFNRFSNLVLPPRPETVESFRSAVAGRPLIIEVGAGKGRFITSVAASRPDAICLGFETGLSLCGACLDRASRKGVGNVFMAWGDARRTIPMLVAPGTAIAAFLLFPDPWWKKKHASRRHGPLMGNTIADALAPGAVLVVKSDVEPYLHEIVAAFLSTGRYESIEPAAAGAGAMPDTDREARLKASGNPVFTAALMRS